MLETNCIDVLWSWMWKAQDRGAASLGPVMSCSSPVSWAGQAAILQAQVLLDFPRRQGHDEAGMNTESSGDGESPRPKVD